MKDSVLREKTLANSMISSGKKKKLKEVEMAAADMSRYTAKRQRCYPSRGKRKISKCKEKSRDKSSVAPKTPTGCLTSSLSGL